MSTDSERYERAIKALPQVLERLGYRVDPARTSPGVHVVAADPAGQEWMFIFHASERPSAWARAVMGGSDLNARLEELVSRRQLRQRTLSLADIEAFARQAQIAL